ncbi:uncharacterized protein LOC134563368 [Prinia subflava]|uniref:uncharacterized protein LOC134563368 n=1 Tax=Prinia subflava TaxID=208062 RepID=UPI002FE2B158
MKSMQPRLIAVAKLEKLLPASSERGAAGSPLERGSGGPAAGAGRGRQARLVAPFPFPPPCAVAVRAGAVSPPSPSTHFATASAVFISLPREFTQEAVKRNGWGDLLTPFPLPLPCTTGQRAVFLGLPPPHPCHERQELLIRFLPSFPWGQAALQKGKWGGIRHFETAFTLWEVLRLKFKLLKASVSGDSGGMGEASGKSSLDRSPLILPAEVQRYQSQEPLEQSICFRRPCSRW